MRMGIPRILTTDNGGEFKNALDSELSKLLGIKRIFTTPYHPQACSVFSNCMVIIWLIKFCRQMVLMSNTIKP